MSLTADAFANAAGVSRETLEQLARYVALLREWNETINLVSEASLADVWHRHIWDSVQLARYIPAGAKTLADLGSGAGLPAIPLAVLLGDHIEISMFESITKKCRFLETVSKELGLNAKIVNARMEGTKLQPFDVVTARACAPLPKLLPYAARFQGANTVNLFLKGQSVEGELTEARKVWNIVL